VSLTADAALLILEGRYDYASARVILKAAATKAGLDPKGPFDAEALADSVLAVGERADGVVAALRAQKSAPKAKKPAPKPAPTPVAEAPPEAESPAADEAPAGEPEASAEDGDAEEAAQAPSRRRRSKK
jgi:hypothetical protein